MNEDFAIQFFEGKKVRIVWDAEKEKYYFAIVDIVQVLTDSADATAPDFGDASPCSRVRLLV